MRKYFEHNIPYWMRVNYVVKKISSLTVRFDIVSEVEEPMLG